MRNCIQAYSIHVRSVILFFLAFSIVYLLPLQNLHSSGIYRAMSWIRCMSGEIVPLDHKVGPPSICSQQIVGPSPEIAYKGHTLCPRIEIIVSKNAGNQTWVTGLEDRKHGRNYWIQLSWQECYRSYFGEICLSIIGIYYNWLYQFLIIFRFLQVVPLCLFLFICHCRSHPEYLSFPNERGPLEIQLNNITSLF